MERDELLKKISNNKILLFIIPNLIYIYRFLLYYIGNRDIEVLYYEVVILSGIFLLLNFIIYKVIYRLLGDYQKSFFIMCFISLLFLIRVNIIVFLIMIVFILLLIIDFKKIIKFKLDSLIFIFSFIIISLFSYSFIVSSYKEISNIFKIRHGDNKVSFKINNNSDLPNIYYIHCDATMSFSYMKKYFNNSSYYLYDYLSNNNYYINDNASFIGGHRTATSLVALFNPYYYDNFYKDYLNNLEDVNLGKKKSFDYIVNYNELEDRRLNNELFNALKKKGYTTIGIGEYNQYTSFNTDYFYDYYFYDYYMRHLVDNKSGLRYIKKNNSNLRKLLYIRLVHFKSFVYNTIFGNLIKDINLLDNKDIDYTDIDISNYGYINDTSYWPSKAIIKGINESFKYDNRFLFIDYNLNHVPITFDSIGNKISDKYMYNLNYYNSNYDYSSLLLVDMLKYIHDNDKYGIIILESDHGIHTYTNDNLIKFFNTDINGAQDIRNSVMSAIYIPDKFKNGDEEYLNNPLNISRYLVNNYVGNNNYDYLD